jgi:hypothetical protein
MLQQGNRSLTVGSSNASKGNAAERLRGFFFSFFFTLDIYIHIPFLAPFSAASKPNGYSAGAPMRAHRLDVVS